jgi:hypothetical protein
MPVQQDSIKDAKDDVTKRVKRMKCTSWTLAILGVLGLGVSLVHSFGARNIAEKIIQEHQKHPQKE